MSKVQNFAEITPNIPFTEFDFYELYRETFENTELGRIKRLLPLKEMAENLGLVRKSMAPKRGPKPFFLLPSRRKGGADVLEDVHATEFSEADGTVEWQHPLPDLLRHYD